jgi:ribokinase
VDRSGPVTTRSLVLLDGSGERTIVNLTRASVPLPSDLAEIAADCCYVRSADGGLAPLLTRLAVAVPVLAHLPPLQPGALPVQVLMGSAADLPGDFLADPFAAGRRIAGVPLEWVVITAGAAGARAYGPRTVLERAAPRVEVVDSTGAGDVFAAGLAHALARGWDMERALATGVAWGSASVQYPGTVPPPGGLPPG